MESGCGDEGQGQPRVIIDVGCRSWRQSTGVARTGLRRDVVFCLGFESWRCPWAMQGRCPVEGGASLETCI